MSACQYCGDPFIPASPTSRYCSQRCYREHKKQKTAERRAAALSARAAVEDPLFIPNRCYPSRPRYASVWHYAQGVTA